MTDTHVPPPPLIFIRLYRVRSDSGEEQLIITPNDYFNVQANPAEVLVLTGAIWHGPTDFVIVGRPDRTGA